MKILEIKQHGPCDTVLLRLDVNEINSIVNALGVCICHTSPRDSRDEAINLKNQFEDLSEKMQ